MKLLFRLFIIFISFVGTGSVLAMHDNPFEYALFNTKESDELHYQFKDNAEIKGLTDDIFQLQREIDRINYEFKNTEKQLNGLKAHTSKVKSGKEKNINFLRTNGKDADKLIDNAEQYHNEIHYLRNPKKAKITKKQPIPIENALEMALSSENPELEAVQIANKYRIVNINAKDHNPKKAQTIIHALFNEPITPEGLISALNVLLVWGIDVNAQDYKGNTALHYAVSQKNIDAIRLLCGVGADVNIQNEKGNIPLFELLIFNKAIRGNVKECIKELLLRGSDLNQENNAGDSIVKYLAIIEKSKKEQEKRNKSGWMEYFSSSRNELPKQNKYLSKLHKLVTKNKPVQQTIYASAEVLGKCDAFKRYCTVNHEIGRKTEHPIYYAALAGEKEVVGAIADCNQELKTKQISAPLFGNIGRYTPGQLLLLAKPLMQVLFGNK